MALSLLALTAGVDSVVSVDCVDETIVVVVVVVVVVLSRVVGDSVVVVVAKEVDVVVADKPELSSVD